MTTSTASTAAAAPVAYDAVAASTATSPSRLLGFFDAAGVGFTALRRNPALASGLIAAVLIQGVLQGLLIWAIRNVLIALSAGEDASTLAVRIAGALLIFGIWLMRAGSAYLADSLAMRLATRVEIGAMYDVLEKLLGLPIAFFDRHSQGDLVMASYHDLKGIRATVVEVGRLILYISQVAGLAVAAMLLSPQLALVGMLTVPLGAVPAWWFGQRMTQAADRERRAVTSLHDSFLQVSSGIRAIRVNRIERRLVERAHKIGSELRSQMVRNAELRGVARFLLESVSGLGLILILALGGRDVASGRMEWPTLMGLLVAVMALYQPIVNVLHTYGTLRSALPNLVRVQQIMTAADSASRVGRPVALRQAPSTIELRDVSFWYDDEQRVASGASAASAAPAALHHISASFTRGETIGIVGPSGAGKSTLMAMLLGFYEPTSGAVLFDGVDARRVSRADLMDLSALVLQEPFLFGASVAENIGAGRPGASMAEIERAARAADLHEEILLMPDGYDTVLGRGAASRGVSVGQKQRISIAAALLKNAPLLFLDEATSSLDPAAERKVQAAMHRLMAGRTTFVIAHRMSTLARADRILVLDQGRLAGLGTHAELITRCEVYARLWTGQDCLEGA
jgi:ABC-type multidrug transport system fused ATPase/permease subunit